MLVIYSHTKHDAEHILPFAEIVQHMLTLRVAMAPSKEAALTNRAAMAPADARALGLPRDAPHVLVRASAASAPMRLTVAVDDAVSPGELAFSNKQREWLQLALGDSIAVGVMPAPRLGEPGGNVHLARVQLAVSQLRRAAESAALPPVDTDRLAAALAPRLGGMVVSAGQPLVADFAGQTLLLRVSALDRIDIELPKKEGAEPEKAAWGIVEADATKILFQPAEDSLVRLAGTRGVHAAAAVGPDFRFADMGIGGLDDEFWTIFRRAFVSRIYPPELVRRLGVRHVKGLLLYGPPGTGKTLMARQIARMLNARELKVVNGPEVLNKFVGQSEENIRALFRDAEAEYKAKGDASALHIVIFDELDAICKQRGGKADGTGVGDSVVNQLLAKMDGVEELHNVLVIGMTNRLDLIDDALLRPGRFEVKLEIPLPDERGRLQILRIHTAAMRSAGVLEDADALLSDVAGRTNNYTGAELVGLVNSATSFALNRHVLVDGRRPDERATGDSSGAHAERGVRVDADSVAQCRVTRADFERALAENRAAYGIDADEFAAYGHAAVDLPFSPAMRAVVAEAQLCVRQLAAQDRRPALATLLLHGGPGTGKSSVGARLALDSGFPFVKVLSPHTLVAAGGTEAAKAAAITRLFADAYKSPLSLILVDDLEDILEYVDVGPRFSTGLLATLKAYLRRLPPPPAHRLLVVATTRDLGLMRRLGVADLFRTVLEVPCVADTPDLVAAVRRICASDSAVVAPDAVQRIVSALSADARPFAVPIRTLAELLEAAAQDPADVPGRFLEAFERFRV